MGQLCALRNDDGDDDNDNDGVAVTTTEDSKITPIPPSCIAIVQMVIISMTTCTNFINHSINWYCADYISLSLVLFGCVTSVLA